MSAGRAGSGLCAAPRLDCGAGTGALGVSRHVGASGSQVGVRGPCLCPGASARQMGREQEADQQTGQEIQSRDLKAKQKIKQSAQGTEWKVEWRIG